VVAGALLLTPRSDTAHTVTFLAYTFVVAPLLFFVAPILTLIQIALLVYHWRQRGHPAA
jgi:hypothetical protein